MAWHLLHGDGSGLLPSPFYLIMIFNPKNNNFTSNRPRANAISGYPLLCGSVRPECSMFKSVISTLVKSKSTVMCGCHLRNKP